MCQSARRGLSLSVMRCTKMDSVREAATILTHVVVATLERMFGMIVCAKN